MATAQKMKSPSEPKRIDGKTGRFYEIDGRLLPSVTHILSCIGKPALIQWAAKEERLMVMEASADLYADIHGTPIMSRPTYIATLDGRIGKLRANQKLLAKAGEIGSQVHALVEWHIRRMLQQKVGPEPKVEERAMWAFMAWEDWAKQVNLKPIFIEQKVFSLTHGYAGTMDLLAEVSGQLTLIDFKTGKAIYAEAHLQNVAYQVALAEMGQPKPDQGMIVRLPKNETDPEFETAICPAVSELFSTFLAVKTVFAWWYQQEQAYQEKREAAKLGMVEEKKSGLPQEQIIPPLEAEWIRVKELSNGVMTKKQIVEWAEKQYGITPGKMNVNQVGALVAYLNTQQTQRRADSPAQGSMV